MPYRVHAVTAGNRQGKNLGTKWSTWVRHGSRISGGRRPCPASDVCRDTDGGECENQLRKHAATARHSNPHERRESSSSEEIPLRIEMSFWRGCGRRRSGSSGRDRHGCGSGACKSDGIERARRLRIGGRSTSKGDRTGETTYPADQHDYLAGLTGLQSQCLWNIG